MRKFKVGDRVKAKESVAGIPAKRYEGTVVHLQSGDSIGVEFETRLPSGGHTCQNHGKAGYCRYGSSNEFELLVGDWDE